MKTPFWTRDFYSTKKLVSDNPRKLKMPKFWSETLPWTLTKSKFLDLALKLMLSQRYDFLFMYTFLNNLDIMNWVGISIFFHIIFLIVSICINQPTRIFTLVSRLCHPGISLVVLNRSNHILLKKKAEFNMATWAQWFILDNFSIYSQYFSAK